MATELELWLEWLNPGLGNAFRILWLACAKLYGGGANAGESVERVRTPPVGQEVGEADHGGGS